MNRWTCGIAVGQRFSSSSFSFPYIIQVKRKERTWTVNRDEKNNKQFNTHTKEPISTVHCGECYWSFGVHVCNWALICIIWFGLTNDDYISVCFGPDHWSRLNDSTDFFEIKTKYPQFHTRNLKSTSILTTMFSLFGRFLIYLFIKLFLMTKWQTFF